MEKVEKVEQEERKDEPVKELKPAQHVRKQQKYYVAPDLQQGEEKGAREKGEDPRVKYGVYGNTMAGWRERLRPARYVITNVRSI